MVYHNRSGEMCHSNININNNIHNHNYNSTETNELIYTNIDSLLEINISK